MNIDLYQAAPVLIGSMLDSFVGDPYTLPHPVRLFGRMIAFFDRIWNRGNYRKLKGSLMTLLLVAVTALFFFVLMKITRDYQWLHILLVSVFFFYGLSNRSLLDEAWKVEAKLLTDDTDGARQQLSWIVGRDTNQLSGSQIRIATLETLSENLSDGVVAPLFYFAIGGIPAMMAYKMINTLDSMVGYKNDRYREFGFASAKLDDLANFIPARLTALLMVIVSGKLRALRFIRRYGSAHASPNSGYPESALAGILDCKMGGPNSYHGKIVEKPYIGENARVVTHGDFCTACTINIRVTLLCILILLIGAF
ncbi:MAG: adenosylcobinamide-phosphate synthase CbiB [Bacteroidales bacterium]